MVELSGSETRVAVDFSTRWLSSDRGRSEKFWILLGCGYWYIIHGEYWGFLFVAFSCLWEISMGSCYDLEKIQLKGLSSNILLGTCQMDEDNLHEWSLAECVGFGKAISNVTLEPKP